jgi:hypothetical protein
MGGSGGAWGQWTRYKGGRKKWKIASPAEVMAGLGGLVPEKFIVEINTIDDLMKIPKPHRKGKKKKHGKDKGGFMRYDFDKGIELDLEELDFL